MKLLLSVAIGGALGTAALPHLPAPNDRVASWESWIEREFTFRRPLWHTLQAYPRWSTHQRWRFE